MKCYICDYDGEFRDLSIKTIHGDAWLTDKIFVCPNCGALHSDLNGKITQKDRKP